MIQPIEHVGGTITEMPEGQLFDGGKIYKATPVSPYYEPIQVATIEQAKRYLELCDEFTRRHIEATKTRRTKHV
jgi:hypothetical protein